MKTNFLQNMMLPLVASTFFATEAFAQTINVKGVVKDEAGMPVIGANVLVKGTTNGTITDLDGNFQLEAREGDVIEISYIGYTAQELPASATMNITLREDSELLGEVVVIGYGQVKKEDATGSVTALKPDKISKGVTTSPQDMITGKIAGVNVVSTGGTPGAGATIRIRGGSSLNASNDPLVVIDGLAMDNDGIKGMSNALSLVNPNDIETFTVLKDASATAIYGSRALRRECFVWEIVQAIRRHERRRIPCLRKPAFRRHFALRIRYSQYGLARRNIPYGGKSRP